MKNQSYKSNQVSQKPSRFLFIAVTCLFLLTSYNICHIILNDKSNQAEIHLSLPEEQRAYESKPVESQPEPWQIIDVKRGDTLSVILRRIGQSSKTLDAIIKTKHGKALTKIKPQQTIKIKSTDGTVDQLIYPMNARETLEIIRQGNNYQSRIHAQKIDNHEHFASFILKGSIYNSAKQQGIPLKLIRQMNEIFKWEINFARDIRTGDIMTLLYEAQYIENKLIDTGHLLAVTIKTKSKTYHAIRYKTPQGDYDYFTPEGRSLNKAFTRYPLRFTHISSTFSLSRMHPILHYRRPHKGIDLSAPIGTPVTATGNGRIVSIGRDGAYGNVIKIRHDNVYSSLYAHLLKFRKGLSRGSFVKRDEVIGYVGQSGLADGPHCHYEFHIHNQAKNPTTVPLPLGLSIPTHSLAAFKWYANSIIERLKLYENAQFAGLKNLKRKIG